MLAGNKGPTLHTQSFSHILSKRAELESQCPLDGLYSRWPDFIFRTQEQHMATMGIVRIRRPVPSTDQALPSCFYFRSS